MNNYYYVYEINNDNDEMEMRGEVLRAGSPTGPQITVGRICFKIGRMKLNSLCRSLERTSHLFIWKINYNFCYCTLHLTVDFRSTSTSKLRRLIIILNVCK